MQQRTAARKQIISAEEWRAWADERRDMLARITGIRGYVDVLVETARALQPIKEEERICRT